MIERGEYLEELKRWKDKDLIKVVPGIRRSGKSTLFELFIKYLKENKIEDDQIIKNRKGTTKIMCCFLILSNKYLLEGIYE